MHLHLDAIGGVAGDMFIAAVLDPLAHTVTLVSGTTYDVAVDGITSYATVTASVSAGAGHDAAGNDWLPTSELVVRRTYSYSDSAVLPKEAQEQRLWREMQDDAVQQIVRRLQAARKPA